MHGDLQVTVADTGLGFAPGGASTSGTGLGLSNIRERLKLLYGDRASLTIEANQVDGQPLGTRVTICGAVPVAAHRRSRRRLTLTSKEKPCARPSCCVFVAMLVLLLVGIAAARRVRERRTRCNGVTVTDRRRAVLGFGARRRRRRRAAIGVVFVGLLVALASLASVAVVVPIVLVAVVAAVLFSLVVGLAPILVPVLLLVVGPYVLLSRRDEASLRARERPAPRLVSSRRPSPDPRPHDRGPPAAPTPHRSSRRSSPTTNG